MVSAPNTIPVITEEQAAFQAPELTVLSAMAHGHEPMAQAIARAAIAAVQGLDAEQASLYSDLVVSSLNDAARIALEKLMQRGKYEYQSDFVRKYILQGRLEGRLEGR